MLTQTNMQVHTANDNELMTVTLLVMRMRIGTNMHNSTQTAMTLQTQVYINLMMPYMAMNNVTMKTWMSLATPQDGEALLHFV